MMTVRNSIRSNQPAVVCRLVAAAASAAFPAVVEACSMCTLPSSAEGGIYTVMSLAMSALPLTLAGGVIYWLWRRYS